MGLSELATSITRDHKNDDLEVTIYKSRNGKGGVLIIDRWWELLQFRNMSRKPMDHELVTWMHERYAPLFAYLEVKTTYVRISAQVAELTLSYLKETN
ncbi:hypothetical protein Kallioja_00014 [Pseudomonas phage vB_PpuP-Kallioja]